MIQSANSPCIDYSPETDPIPSDRSLLRRFRKGSQDAATELYLRYAPKVYALVKANCSKELADQFEPEDIVQSVFRRFFSRVGKGSYDVPEGDELWGLFLVISLNRIRSGEVHCRAGKRDVRLVKSVGENEFILDQVSRTDEDSMRILQMTVEEAMALLQDNQQTMLELRIQGYDVDEIADRVGRSKRTVERNLQIVRARLRSLLM